MRLLFISDMHPSSPLVAGMRLYNFAREMARRGHQVVLMTAPLQGEVDGEKAAFDAHDWSEPFVLAARRFDVIEPPSGAAGRLVGRLRTIWRLVGGTGPLPVWRQSLLEAFSTLDSRFVPEIVWPTFGNVTALLVARDLARASRCAWIIDVKDNWTAFVARPLRPLVARRLASAAGFTANSRLHLDAFRSVLPDKPSALVYSGVAETFYRKLDGAVTDPLEARSLLLVGSTYRPAVLDEFLAAITRWRAALPPQDRDAFHFRYAGVNVDQVSQAVERHGLAACSTVTRSVPLAQLAELMAQAFCACYLWHPTTFHHKLLELLVASKNVLAFPGEHRESIDLAAQSSTPFTVCATPEDIGPTLDLYWSGHPRDDGGDDAPGWHWRDFAGTLESFFERLLAADKDIDSTREQASEA